MPKNLLRRYLPKPKSIREHPALRPVSRWLKEPEIWHLNRRTVAGATFIGLFCAFLPIPFQMLLAAMLAVIFRCNIALSVALVWISNPLTITPIFYFTYRLGAWLLNMEVAVATIELSWSWWRENLGLIGYPLLFGSLVCAWISGVTGFIFVRVAWRLHVIQRWKERKARRAQRRLRRRLDKQAR